MIFSALSNVFIRRLSAICERKLSSHVFIKEGIHWMEFSGSDAVKSRGPVILKLNASKALMLGCIRMLSFSRLLGFSLLGKMVHSAPLGY